MFYDEPKTLIVVYKDEIVMNQFKKMVETKDDLEDKQIGIKDNSIQIVSWTEKIWLEQKKVGNISNKVLFIGDIKGTQNWIPVLDLKFSKYGSKFGIAGNQAVLYVETKDIKSKEEYNLLLEELKTMKLPQIAKEDYYVDFSNIQGENVGQKFISILKKVEKKVETISGNNLKRQLLFYGLVKVYESYLEEFISK